MTAAARARSALLATAVAFAGGSGNNFTAPHRAELVADGDLDIRVRAALTNWSGGTAGALISKYHSTGNQRGWVLRAGFQNVILQWSVTGAADLTASSTVNVPFANGLAAWVRAVLVRDNGAGGYTVTFYYSYDGTRWTQLGDPVTGAAPTSVHPSTAALEVGSRNGGTALTVAGKTLQAEVRIGGTVVANPDFTAVRPTGARAPATVADTCGNTFTGTGATWSYTAVTAAPSRDPLVVCEGDSMTLDYPQYLPPLLGCDATIQNISAGSQTLVHMAADGAGTDALLNASAHGRPVLVVWGGTNDLFFGASAATVLTRLSEYCAARRAAGWRVAVLTMLPRSGNNGTTPVTFEADRQTVNTAIRSGWEAYADALVDVAADPRIGDAGDELDPDYYEETGGGARLHLAVDGELIVAAAVAAAVTTLATT